MKIAVYTIAKDEAKFVERWQNSACDADSLHILDTGSTDQTVTAAKDFGVNVETWKFDPWRFDHARNMNLQMVPADTDLCIALDMDEILVDGWRDELESVASDVTRPRYEYTWSWAADGVPGLQYGGDKIHSRHGYRWKHPVHETLVPEKGVEVQAWCGLKIHHHPDESKSRGQYFPLLELAVAEDPDDDRNAHYLAREYYFHNMFEESEREFRRHLSMPSAKWGAERAQSCRYLFKITGDVSWLKQAILEAPGRREALVDIALYHYQREEWLECSVAAKTALTITSRPLEYLTEADAWGSLPYDLAAISAYNMGDYSAASRYGVEAVRLSPNEDRLVDNLKFYVEAAA